MSFVGNFCGCGNFDHTQVYDYSMHIVLKLTGLKTQKSKLKKSICITAQIFEKQICESHQFWTICISFFKLEYDRNFQIHWNFEQRSHIAQEFENVRARKGYALLYWSFWQEFTFFQVNANFLKIGGVKFSTFWTPFKLRWNEKKLFVFEAEGIWCWKNFYV